MDSFKHFLSNSREVVANNWKYAAAFSLGSATSFLVSYAVCKSLTGYTNLQLLTKIFLLSKQEEIRNMEHYEALPQCTTRPSNELLAWDALSRAQPKGADAAADPQQYVQQLRDGMKLFVDALQIMPSFVQRPRPHIIHADSKLTGFELVYPGGSQQNGVLFYVHGGAFVGGHCENGYPMLCAMMQYLGCSSFAVDYRVAPQHSIPQSVQDCIQAYRYLVEQRNVAPDKVIMVGESAGATLILLLLHELNRKRDEYKLELPQCAVLLSVLADLELNELPSITANAKADCMSNVHGLRVCCKLGLEKGDTDLRDAKYSPLYAAKWTGLCPLYFSSAATEILLSDAQQCVQKCQENGVEVAYEWHPSLPHGVGAWCAWLPEARDSVVRIVEWIKHIQKR